MQQNRCGYTGKVLSAKQLNIEHKLPKSKGGKDTFQNLMVVDKHINHKRGNRPLKEVGLRPLFNHAEPLPIPASFAIKHCAHPDWKMFFK